MECNTILTCNSNGPVAFLVANFKTSTEICHLFNCGLLKYFLVFRPQSLKDATQSSEVKKKIKHVTWPWRCGDLEWEGKARLYKHPPNVVVGLCVFSTILHRFYLCANDKVHGGGVTSASFRNLKCPSVISSSILKLRFSTWLNKQLDVCVWLAFFLLASEPLVLGFKCEINA